MPSSAGRSIPRVGGNLKSIPRKQRAMMRKGMNNKLKSDIDHDVERLYPIYAESVRNSGHLYSPNPIFAFSVKFADFSDVVTISSSGQAVASVLNFYFRDEVLPFTMVAGLGLRGPSPLMISCIGR